MRLRWTLQTTEDLVAIRDFIARDSPAYAREVAEELYDAAMGIRGSQASAVSFLNVAIKAFVRFRGPS